MPVAGLSRVKIHRSVFSDYSIAVLLIIMTVLYSNGSDSSHRCYSRDRFIEFITLRQCSSPYNTPGLSNWRPAGRIRPATPSNPARSYPPENVVHRHVFCCHFYLLSVVNKLTICWTEPLICKYSTTAVGKPGGNQSFDFNYSIFEQFIVIVG